MTWPDLGLEAAHYCKGTVSHLERFTILIFDFIFIVVSLKGITFEKLGSIF
jgi:hypothetical protein